MSEGAPNSNHEGVGSLNTEAVEFPPNPEPANTQAEASAERAATRERLSGHAAQVAANTHDADTRAHPVETGNAHAAGHSHHGPGLMKHGIAFFMVIFKIIGHGIAHAPWADIAKGGKGGGGGGHAPAKAGGGGHGSGHH